MSKALEIVNADIQSSIEASTSGLGPSPRICAFCKTEYGKYSCPRCRQLYCSVACYKSEKHQTCASSFYRDSVQDAKGAVAGDDVSLQMSTSEKRRLLELVNEYEIDAQERPLGDLEDLVKCASNVEPQSADRIRTHDDENGKDDSKVEREQEKWREDLEDRLMDLDVESAEFEDTWTRLTIREQADFISLAQEHERHAGEQL
ncbi:hypothetical protein V1525DRAFT_413473 [Lipomyces kononenkoae]|uniref:Uncharacterized protein n=1 Tax=Lipomyces kononenkoae TaxID=34357 RepID=A0ACC3SSG2_LIPKO